MNTESIKNVLRKIKKRISVYPPVGFVRMGSLRKLRPISEIFGIDRGRPIDRYFIESFLERQKADIKGRVLEIGDSTYTRKFGHNRIRRSDVLHAVSGNPNATLVGDLSTGRGIPMKAFDCMILTQTFLVIYDIKAAIWNAYNALRTGGVLLATVPGLSQISRYDMDRWGDYWRFTNASVKLLFGEVFGEENVSVETHGNVLVACAFLHGLAAEELTKRELEYNDPNYQVVITVKAVKKRESNG